MLQSAPPTLALHKLTPLLKNAIYNGLTKAELSAHLKLRQSSFVEPFSGAITPQQYIHLVSFIGTKISDETCSISKRVTLPGTIEFILSQVLLAQQLGDALRTLADATNYILGASFFGVTQKQDGLLMSFDNKEVAFSSDNIEFLQVTMEHVLMYILAIISVITGGRADARLVKMYFKRNSKIDDFSFLSAIPINISYRQSSSGLLFSPDAQDLPIVLTRSNQPIRDSVTRRSLELLNGGLLTSVGNNDVQSAVKQQFNKGLRLQADVAESLHMSQATLKRRLCEETTSFKALRNNYLNAVAIDALTAGDALSSIADMLGFSDSRSFARAFKAWNGVTPADYKTQNIG